jgi:hypothetical protein
MKFVLFIACWVVFVIVAAAAAADALRGVLHQCHGRRGFDV